MIENLKILPDTKQ